MSDEEFDTEYFDLEQELRDLYHSPASGYCSIESLYKRTKEKDLNVSRKQVRNFLKTQDTYTKTFPKGGPGLGKRTYRQSRH